MNTYRVEVDVSTVYTTEVEASDEEQAVGLAIKEAYEDTWSCDARYGGADIYTIDEVEHEGEEV